MDSVEQPWNWVPKYYRVPKKIPIDKCTKTPLYNLGTLWVHYFEAAVSKSNISNKCKKLNLTEREGSGTTTKKFRDYSSIDGGYSSNVWKMVFGNKVSFDYFDERLINSKAHTNDEKLLQKMTDKTRIICHDTSLSDEDRSKEMERITNKYQAKLDKLNKLSVGIRDQIYNNMYVRIKEAINNKKLVTFATKDLKNGQRIGISAGESVLNGIVVNHAYAVCGYEERDGKKYSRLINP